VAIDGGYARILQVDLLHKLHDELRYPSLEALQAGIAKDVADAQAWFGPGR
jgi:riboflavin kinase / FMN adenylyltransferase